MEARRSMSPHSHSADPQRASALDDLVVECLDRMESEGDSALDSLCSSHPEHAAALASRIRTLRAAGLIQMPDAANPAAFPERLGDFELLARLGAGGMGVVYRARQTSLGREVALKLIRPEHMYFEGARERFRREVEATARLQHPGIVPIHTVGEERGVPYFAMELVHGLSLGDVLEKFSGRSPASLAGADLLDVLPGEGTSPLFDGSWWECTTRIVREVAEALEHAHRRGVLHRDLKPSNVMVTRAGRVLLVDFGLSSTRGAKRLTQSGSHLGSMPYMPPEIVAGGAGDGDAKSDVYSLGAALYEVLTLSLPFAADSAPDMLRKIADARVDLLRRRNPAIPRDLEVVCLTAMERDPARRYATAADFARDLTHVLERRPIEARPAGAVLRVARYAQRRPAHAAAYGLAAILVLGVPTALWIQQRAANRDIRSALDEAHVQRDRARASLDIAAQSIEDLLSRVGDGDLDGVPGMDKIRTKILEDALALNEDLISLAPDEDVGVVRAAVARSRVGEIKKLEGRNAEADTMLSSAIEVLEHADPAVLRPGELDWHAARTRMRRASLLREVGRTEDSLADALAVCARLRSTSAPDSYASQRASLLRNALSHAATSLFILGRHEEARTRQKESIVIARRILDENSTAVSLLMLGASLCSLGYQEIQMGALEDAQSTLEEAVAVDERALALDSVSREARTAAADAYINLGTTTWRLMNRRGAIPHYRRAMELLEALVRDYPANTDHATALNDCRASLAGALSEDDPTRDEALALMRAAVASQEALCNARPEERRARATLAVATANLGAMIGRTDHADGLRHFERARTILKDVQIGEPDNPQWAVYEGEWWLGTSELEAKSGDFERAAESLETGQRIYPTEWRVLRRMTGSWIELAQGALYSTTLDDVRREELVDRWLDRGFATFRASVDAGYVDVGDMQDNSLLDPLRERADWAALEQRVLDRAAATGG